MPRALVAAILFAASCTAANATVCERAASFKGWATGVVTAGAAAAGVGLGTMGTASVLGATAVAHSSGQLILTAGAGYVAGTIGTTATAVAAAPVVLATGAVVAVAGGSVLYFCRDELKR
jgi:hypothetical protein